MKKHVIRYTKCLTFWSDGSITITERGEMSPELVESLFHDMKEVFGIGEALAEIDDFILVVHLALKHRYGIGLANVMAKQMLEAESKPKFKGVW